MEDNGYPSKVTLAVPFTSSAVNVTPRLVTDTLPVASSGKTNVIVMFSSTFTLELYIGFSSTSFLITNAYPSCDL